MIAAIVFIIITALAGAGIATMCGVSFETKVGRAWGIIVPVVIALAIIGGILWWLNATEGGSRAKKTFESETKGGLYRTVKVYDMEGELIEQYDGKFDVAEDQTEGITKIKFDCDGKRHVIYCSTGTVVIDEVERKE